MRSIPMVVPRGDVLVPAKGYTSLCFGIPYYVSTFESVRKTFGYNEVVKWAELVSTEVYLNERYRRKKGFNAVTDCLNRVVFKSAVVDFYYIAKKYFLVYDRERGKEMYLSRFRSSVDFFGFITFASTEYNEVCGFVSDMKKFLTVYQSELPYVRIVTDWHDIIQDTNALLECLYKMSIRGTALEFEVKTGKRRGKDRQLCLGNIKSLAYSQACGAKA